MHDLIAELDQARRAVGDGKLGGATAHAVELRRRFHAPVADVWNACTDSERVRRWFLPLSGDLRPGGRFQLEGNAGGTIIECEPPHRLEVTWEFGEMEPSLVALELAPAGDDATELVLRHTVPDDEHWAQYGPGAVGVGWELPIAVLANVIAGNDLPKGGELMADPDTADFMRRSAIAWGAAHGAAGVSMEVAQDAASRTSAFYAPA
jgi:uncharacterized protein YndB with AHSA1/START domain